MLRRLHNEEYSLELIREAAIIRSQSPGMSWLNAIYQAIDRAIDRDVDRDVTPKPDLPSNLKWLEDLFVDATGRDRRNNYAWAEDWEQEGQL